MRIVNTDPSATVMSHEGVIYEAVHGVFDVPEHVAHALLGFPHWLAEHVAHARVAAEQAAAAVDPAQMASRLASLEQAGQKAAQDAAERIAALEAELAAAKHALSGSTPAADAVQPAEPTQDAPAQDPAAEQPVTDGQTPADQPAEPELTRQQKAALTRAANKAAAASADAAPPA